MDSKKKEVVEKFKEKIKEATWSEFYYYYNGLWNHPNDFRNAFGVELDEEMQKELEDAYFSVMRKKVIKDIDSDDMQAVTEMLLDKRPRSEIWSMIAKSFSGRRCCSFFDNTLFVFNEGEGWEELPKEEIYAYTKRFLHSYFSKKDGEEVYASICALNYNAYPVGVEQPEFLNLLPLKNGVLNLNEKRLLPHQFYFPFLKKNILNVAYDPQAQCPQIHAFLDQITTDENQKNLLLDVAAYCLHRANPFQKAFFLVGSGANGKSTYINLLTSLLGEGNVCSYSFQELESSRFKLANLAGKYLNTFADLPYMALKNVSIFKALTGGDVIDAERKYKQRTLRFKNFAKLIFSANKLPRVEDMSDAFIRRVILIEFENVIEKKDQNLLEKLTTEKELSGFLNLLIERLPGVLARGFPEANLEEVKKNYMKKSNSLYAFIDECVEQGDPEDEEEIEKFYLKYQLFCRKRHIIFESFDFFSKHILQELNNAGITSKKTRKTIGTKKLTLLLGVRVKESEDEQLNQIKEENIGTLNDYVN
jgi:putative DNA primase/helicase